MRVPSWKAACEQVALKKRRPWIGRDSEHMEWRQDMPRVLSGIVLIAGLLLLPSFSRAAAERIRNVPLGFSITIPAGFHSVALSTGQSHSGFLYLFRRGSRKGFGTVIGIQRMHGLISPGHIKISDLPPALRNSGKVKLATARWHGFSIDRIDISTRITGRPVEDLTVQVPLEPEAVQIIIIGDRDHRRQLAALADELVASLHGRSNWLSSSAPRWLAQSPNYPAILLAVAAFVLFGGVIGSWFLRRIVPRGVVLVLGAALYLTSWVPVSSHNREALLMIGVWRMLAFLVILVGLFDIARRRPVDISQADPENFRNPTHFRR